MRIAATVATVLGTAAAVAVVTSCEPERREAPSPVASRTAAASPAPSVGPSPVAAVERPRRPAIGGVTILASAARAQAVVAGVVSGVQSVDVHGWRADLRVDTVLTGDAKLGDTVTIAWEELSPSRKVRFQDEERVLLVLDPLPTQSLWRKRFPDRTRRILMVAAAGEAFMTRPDGATLAGLEHYLAMTPSARTGAPGARRLAELVRGAQPAIAREALTLLENDSARADLLGADGAPALLAAARSADRDPALRADALALAARLRLPGTRETALALTEPGSPIRADAYRALAALPDGLPPDVAEGLLTDADPGVRAVGVENLRSDDARARLAAMVRDDPAPTVRLAAGRTILTRFRAAGVPDVTGLLDHPDASVRTGIAEAAGALGPEAIKPLLAVVNEGSERAALAAILGLSQAGPKAAVTIETIADTHPNENVRVFAGLAFGKAPDAHKH